MGTTLAAGAALTAGLVLAPAANAVTPASATATYDCGFWGGGSVTLEATQSGTAATIKITASSVTTPVAIAANTIKATLLLDTNGTGTTTAFTGTVNPALSAGSAVIVGPLNGTVVAGNSLNSYRPASGADALTMVLFGITVGCDATTLQSPGPLVF